MDCIDEATKIKEEALKALMDVKEEGQLGLFFAAYLAKKGAVSGLMSKMKEIPPELRATFGAAANAARKAVEEVYLEKKDEIEAWKLKKKLESEKIDITLPGRTCLPGGKNPYHVVIDEVTKIFLDMGYEVAEGRDVESDLYNFELLNVPKDHPARDMQDTFYLDGMKELLLRTQTSAAQAHAMCEENPKGPIQLICPGKAYRRDDDDMTHSHQFAQIEGLVIGEGISMANLKATLELFVRKMFGEKREIRLRSSYFPFTEPSVEVDVSCFNCGGKGCSLCKGTGWIEILGAGMVNPKVLEACGYDSKKYSGFAFGVGVERVAMLRYGCDDIRRIYANDIRFLDAFQGK
ncbi:MAG: phenylalanine--tRNA ligase subunit alpha [Candidatus Enteromonas sp.]